MHTFTTRIHKMGVLRCGRVPADVFLALGGGRSVPVLASYAGETTETTVVAGGSGCGRLTLRMDVLRPAGLDAGDALEILLHPDLKSREPDILADFQQALQFRPEAAEAFGCATTGMRRQIMLYLDAARKEAVRADRIEKILENLTESSEQ